MSGIRDFINSLANDIRSLGIDCYVSHSSTTFGDSSYAYVGSVKIRHSDHSTGERRFMDEVGVWDFNRKQVIEDVERIHFPERFEKVVTVVWSNPQAANQNKIDTMTDEFVIKSFDGVSKAGKKKYTIIVKNIQVITYKRVAKN